MDNVNKLKLPSNLIKIIKGSMTSMLITLIFLLIFSIVLTFTTVKENTIKPVIIVISTISVLIGTSLNTMKLKKNGIINGGVIGLIYILTIYILSSLTGSGFKLNVYSLIMIIFSILAGMIGGIIGINLK